MNDILANTTSNVATISKQDLSLNNQMKEQISNISTQANSLEIKDKETYDLASTQIKTLETFGKKIKEFYKEPKRKASAAWKAALEAKQAVTDQEAQWLKPVKEAKENLKRKQGAYTRHLLELQQEAERKAEENRRKEEEMAKFLAEKEAQAKGQTVVEPVVVEPVKPKVEFTEPIPKATLVTSYEIKSIDITKLPPVYAGEELVSPKLMVIKRLIKEYNSTHDNKLKIPGVEYETIVKTR